MTPPPARPISVKNTSPSPTPTVHGAGGSHQALFLGSGRWKAEGRPAGSRGRRGNGGAVPCPPLRVPGWDPSRPSARSPVPPLRSGSPRVLGKGPPPAPPRPAALVPQRLFTGSRFSGSRYHCRRGFLTPVRAGGAWHVPLRHGMWHRAQSMSHPVMSVKDII